MKKKEKPAPEREKIIIAYLMTKRKFPKTSELTGRNAIWKRKVFGKRLFEINVVGEKKKTLKNSCLFRMICFYPDTITSTVFKIKY